MAEIIDIMNTRFKVLFLASWYPNEDDPISGIFIKRHAQAVSKYCDVAILYVHKSQHRTRTNVEYSVEDGIKTVRVYSKKPLLNIRFLRIFYRLFDNYFIDSYKGLKVIQKEFGRPHIIHVNVALPAGLVSLFLNIWSKIPFVITEHYTAVSKKNGKIISEYFSGWEKYLLKFLFKKAKKIITVSSEFKLRLINQGFSGNYQVIPNVVDTNLFGYSNNIKFNEIKNILHISLLNEEERKNVSGIIQACKIISNKRQDFCLNIVGGGCDRLKLEELSEELKLKNSFIFFLGRISDEELLKIMSLSNFFVINSYQENFAVVCAEALASGIPVISTRCGGPEDFINKDVGILIEPGNTEELVKAMEYMLDNHCKYNPQKLHDYAKDRFSYEVIGKQIYDVYKDILKEWKIGFGKYRLKIEPDWLVMDIGSGHNPHNRADILVDREIEESPDRSGEKAKIPKDKPFIIADACYLPFKEKSFDFIIASHIAEHIENPEFFCKELMRVSKRGYIETPGILSEILLNETYHKWKIYVKKETLIFEKKDKFKPLSEQFYKIFYYGDNRSGHSPFITENVIFEFILKMNRNILIRIWKYLPYTYTYYPWEKEINFVVKYNSNS